MKIESAFPNSIKLSLSIVRCLVFSSSESVGLGHPLTSTTSMASPKVAAGKVWGNTGQTLCTKSCKGEHLLRYHELRELIQLQGELGGVLGMGEGRGVRGNTGQSLWGKG